MTLLSYLLLNLSLIALEAMRLLVLISSFWLFFNRDLNRGCLVYKFSLRFSGSKSFMN